KRVVMKFHPDIAPIKVAVLPLSKKENLVALARDVHRKIYASGLITGMVQYDDAQSIGRRYRRQDEVGTPLCVTVDFDSLESETLKGTVTVRDRDTMKQDRVPIADLPRHLANRLKR
ncbi:MAG: His/Gly/Thr/Pro-type tRNA ligase C-terminal domain-containing protein, partial [Chloroflexi bacterium]|nr:His/Gly/Thr/Pro-type tRNA ligase C-terminal domain-containing protein [Chloroflexota bacterium]